MPKQILILILAVMAVSCSKWTEPESVGTAVNYPWDRNPELWAEYTASLRAYKQNSHFIVYARLHNSPDKAASEKNFMRSLPDSLDIVSLTNADNFSEYDAEDMALMKEKGIRVLYRVDFASRANEWSDAAALGAYIDGVIASVKKYGLDGYSFTGTPKLGDASAAEMSALLIGKLASAKEKGQLTVFEGDPVSVAEADRDKIDLFVLGTEDMENTFDVRIAVLTATSTCGIPADKILLAAKTDGILSDETRNEYPALEEMTRRVAIFGPLAGLAVYNLENDYWHAEENYSDVRKAIRTLNPSH